ncbi:MAG: cell division protein FtsX [Leadbetterella sp.]
MAIQNKLGTYPTLLITISLTIALLLIGFCGWISIIGNHTIKNLKQNIQIQVFAYDSLTNLEPLKAKLIALNIADPTKPNKGIAFLSKDSVANEFKKEHNQDYSDILGDVNPFKNSFLIKLQDKYINEESLLSLKNQIQQLEGVYEVDYSSSKIKEVIQNLNSIYKVVAVIVFIFFIATLLLINNIIKLALFSQRFIIRTMQLVGATDAFIRKPFLKNSFIQGIVSSAISIFIIITLKVYLWNRIVSVSDFETDKASWILYGILLLLGPIIGVSSTYLSVNRYQKMDLDKLY